jgi:hypothetical protein
MQQHALPKGNLVDSRVSTADCDLSTLNDKKSRLLQDIGILEDVQEQLIAEVGSMYASRPIPFVRDPTEACRLVFSGFFC